MESDDPLGDVLDRHGLPHPGSLPGEVEERLHHAPGTHRLGVDDLGALTVLGTLRIDLEQLRECGDRRERIIQLVRHSGDQRAELREPVRFEEPALQQELAGHVDGEEQEPRRRLARRHVLDHRVDFTRRLTAGVERQMKLLPPVDGVAQRGEEGGALGLRRPIVHRAATQRRRIRSAEQPNALGIRRENPPVDRHDQRGDWQ